MKFRTMSWTAMALTVVACGAAFAADEPNAQPAATPAAQPAPAENPAMVYVTMSTSKGDIKIELDPEKAPISTANFLSYVDKKFYEGTIFHRVIGTFMIQGGGFTEDMKQKPTDPPIKNEWQNGLKNMRGTIAMARTSAPDSATSQFYINVVDNPMLDQPRGGAAYAVFGKVVGGMEVVDAIKAAPTGNKGGMPDVPTETITIKSVTQTSGMKTAEVKAKADAMLAEAQKAAAEASKKQWDAALAFVKTKEGDVEKGVKSPSGLWHTDVKVGEGAQPASPNSTVTVHYTVWLSNGTEVQSSRPTNEPATFRLNQVIKGWTEGVGSMKAGGRRLLVVPADLAYGTDGRPPAIPGNSTLVFDVELLDVKN